MQNEICVQSVVSVAVSIPQTNSFAIKRCEFVSPSRMSRPSLTYGEAVQYGMENVSWLRRHSQWGK